MVDEQLGIARSVMASEVGEKKLARLRQLSRQMVNVCYCFVLLRSTLVGTVARFLDSWLMASIEVRINSSRIEVSFMCRGAKMWGGIGWPGQSNY